MNLFVLNFNIRILEKNDNDLFFSTEGEKVLDITSDTSLFNPNAPSILADPFLFEYNDELFLFYEHQDKWIGGKGRISMRKTKDLKVWTPEVDVLEEPFHLSFPWVFSENGKIYMLPETGGSRSIRLYQADDDTLTKWSLCKILMEDEQPWTDSVIYKKEDNYYLFTSHDVHSKQVQHLFVSDNLFGPYKEHPSSPIYEGRDGGRNAGSIIEYKGDIYRPVQVCLNSYGEQTSIMKIEMLTPEHYKESLFKNNIVDTSIKAYRDGGHQFNPISFKGKCIVATDNRSKNYNIVESFRKVWKIIVK
jgi:hypothetical protein